MEYRSALVTGASSGLGRGLSAWFARRGVRVYAAARRAAQLEALKAEVRDGIIEPVVLDVTNAEATWARVRALDGSCGGLDLVIANAGVGSVTPATHLQWNEVKHTIDVNVTGAAATLVAALPGMLERGRGHLVGISSFAAFRGLPRMAAYSASKAFLAVFLESLRVDLRGTGVRVTSIHPGYVKTELTAGSKAKLPFLLEAEDAVERMGKAIVRLRPQYVFPWPLAVAARPLKVMPNVLYDPLIRKF
ncbi:MAG: SDR family NAD(P)-dependent oxidoreductase [Myxococcota bacterium]